MKRAWLGPIRQCVVWSIATDRAHIRWDVIGFTKKGKRKQVTICLDKKTANITLRDQEKMMVKLDEMIKKLKIQPDPKALTLPEGLMDARFL